MNQQAKNAAARLFSAGLTHQGEGRLTEARQCYEEGLKLDPGQADALFLLGQLLFETGHLLDGEQKMRQALAANPKAVNYWRGLAIQFFNKGRFHEAQSAFEQAIQWAPSDLDNVISLALTLEQLGEINAAIEMWQRVQLEVGASVEGSSHLARLLMLSGRDAEAFAAVARWILLEPAAAAAYAVRADLYERCGKSDKALADRVQAASCAPADALLRGSLGLSLMQAGLTEAALEQFDESVALAQENAQLHFNRGVAYAKAGYAEVACRAYETALHYDSDSPAILTNLANQYASLGRKAEARTLYERAIELQPQYAAAHFNLGMLHLDEGRRLDASDSLEHAAVLEPDDGLIAAHLLFQKMHLCRWDGIEELSRRVMRSIETNAADIPPFIVFSMPGTTAQIQRRCAENHSAYLKTVAGTNERVHPQNIHERLRVGYLSADFKNHATAYLIIEMLEAHDRSRFEIFGLSYGVDDHSTMRRRVEDSVEHFVELASLPSSEAVAKITALELDVLIDIKGYTEGNHSEWLQYHLAPVQINWLGYPGTLGAPWVDYLLGDAWVVPMAHQAMFSERLLHLPGSYQPCCRFRECAPPMTRAEAGFPDDALVLCSFNQTYKITPELFSLWLDVLHEVPAAVLWLWASNPWAEIELRKVAEKAGVATERLVFAEGCPQPEHLARIGLADVALDTFPCNGHTTTSDALWAGVPVVTLQGEAFAARVAAGLLEANGLHELVATTAAEYRQIILRFCRESLWRDSVRAKTQALRSASTFFDGLAFARKFENLLQDVVYQRHGNN
ncbi:MAG: tetratricopeptide repeat protein [Betaproteobacteria bacterium]